MLGNHQSQYKKRLQRLSKCIFTSSLSHTDLQYKGKFFTVLRVFITYCIHAGFKDARHVAKFWQMFADVSSDGFPYPGVAYLISFIGVCIRAGVKGYLLRTKHLRTLAPRHYNIYLRTPQRSESSLPPLKTA